MSNTRVDPYGHGPRPICVLLIDDQEVIAKAVENMLAGEDDIQFHYCSDPTCAIDTAADVKPTVILQDLIMPEVDGMTLVRFFRANPATRDIPLIVLSSEEQPEIKAEAFALGANDYMVKLPDKLEVLARIRYHSRGYIALLERNEAYRALAKELAEAAEYVISLLPTPLEGAPATSWCFVPSTQLGGDSFGYHWIDDEHLAIYLLDVCGHGVGAALLSVSAMNVLRSHALPDTDFLDPAAVLGSLNDTFPMEQHNSMFFTMWYGVYDLPGRTLHYASAGHPPAVLVTGPRRAEAEVKLLSTPGMVVGGMPDIVYTSATCPIDTFGALFVYSDGAYEIERAPDGPMWTLEAWTNLLADYARSDAPADPETVRKQVAEIQGNDQFEDDFSLLDVRF